MIIYLISLQEQKKADVFVKFMKEEYFPSIHKSATRVGEVTSLSLVQSHDSDAARQFMLQVGWSGLPGHDIHAEDDKVQKKFESFGVKLRRAGIYEEVAKWPGENV